MALTLSNNANNKKGQFTASTVLLRIVVALVAVVLVFQLKLLSKVNEIQANVLGSPSNDAPSGKFSLPSADNHWTSSIQRRAIDNNSGSSNNDNINEKYRNCPFRDSSLVESIYVYPTPGTPEWEGDILSDYAKTHPIPDYPWVATDQQSKSLGVGPYQTTSQLVQYNTELLVRDVITHPDSCLRTYDPEKATLFYVPYLPATEFHNGTRLLGEFDQTPYGAALQDAIVDGKYGNWEQTFGLTSKYWKRKGGSDHIMVYSEPMHGLWHPRSKRGNYHFINSQYQLKAPIAISVELSTTFVDMYPMCARKNILMPYPNTDGRWFNGVLDQETKAALAEVGIHGASDSPAALPAEVELERRHLTKAFAASATGVGWNVTVGPPPRVMAQFYKAGNHGECTGLRRSMANDYKCTPSGKLAAEHKINNYIYGYRQSTFCPCPGGDSPSAKRMYDALLAGCIPIILSHDFVWPFTTEFDRSGPNMTTSTTTVGASATMMNGVVDDDSSQRKIVVLDPRDYSIRLPVADHQNAKFDNKCERSSDNGNMGTDLQSLLDAIPEEEIVRLRHGVARAAYEYSYYRVRPDLPDNPLREGILPDGGAAHVLVRALEERAGGELWPDCERELEGKDPYHKDSVSRFRC